MRERILKINGHYWNGRGPVAWKFATEEKATEALYDYVRRNWSELAWGKPLPEDMAAATAEYFDDEDIAEEYEIFALDPLPEDWKKL